LAIAALALAGALVAVVGGAGGSAQPGAAAAEPSSDRVISVAGEGRVFVRQDLAIVTLGVELSNPELAAAQREARQRMDAVLAELKRRGIPEAKVKTVSYNIWVERNYEQPDQPIIGYRVFHIVEVQVQPVDRAGEIIEAAVNAGANTIQGIGFTVADPSAAIRQARELAVRDARDRAVHLAQLLGVNLGAPIRITEGGAFPPVMPVEARAGAEGAGPLPPGETVVSVVVSIEYAVK
jgi:uncharacterized protein YggE